jgi:hypothetical protein
VWGGVKREAVKKNKTCTTEEVETLVNEETDRVKQNTCYLGESLQEIYKRVVLKRNQK